MSAESVLAQRDAALKAANIVRLRRAELRSRIAAGDVSVADVLRDPPPFAAGWAIGDMVSAQRRWGDARARNLLAGLFIGEKRPLRALTVRQRLLLADAVDAEEAQHREVMACAAVCACGNRMRRGSRTCVSCRRAAAERRRATLVRMWEESRSPAQIAAVLGSSEDSVKRQVRLMRQGGVPR